MLVAAFSLTNCTKEVPATPEVEDNTFTLFADFAETKTTNDGAKTVWAEGDEVSVFQAAEGTTAYSSNYQFAIKDVANGVFHGVIDETKIAPANDWYAIYPYSKYLTTPAETEGGYTSVGLYQNQRGNDSMAHLDGKNYPMWGSDKNVPYNVLPQVTMKHMSSLIEVEVVNKSNAPFAVSSVTLTAEQNIVGQYYIDITGDAPVFNELDGKTYYKEAKLAVEGGADIPVDGSAKFYLVVKPFTAASGETLTLSVNGIAHPVEMTKDVVFEAGKVKKMKFTRDEVVEVPDETIIVADVAAGLLAYLGVTLENKEDPREMTEELKAQGFAKDCYNLIAGNPYQLNSTLSITYTHVSGTNLRIWYNDMSLRFYKKNIIDLKSTKKLRKIEFVCKDGKGTFTSDTGSVEKQVWTGEATDIKFTAADNSATITFQKIHIYYAE